ncbi:MAG: VTT domain-containing protein [Clostridia bacterium]|nr:VTT domain-containing protein [Clostridia bacterium]
MMKWLKIIFIILIFATISVSIYFILDAYNLTNISNLKTLIESTKHYSIPIYFIICTISSILLCFIPLAGTILSTLGIILFDPLTTFIVTIISNTISASVLFLIGDKLGEGFARKLIGSESFEQAQNLVNNKSKILLPVLYVVPIFPHEAITLVAGMTKLKYWYILLVNIIHTIIDTALACFIGSNLSIWCNLSIIDWIIFINLIAIDIYFLLKLEHKISSK